MIYIGIDPGLSGAIAWAGDQQGAVKMPRTEADIFECLRKLERDCSIKRIGLLGVVEKLGGMPRDPNTKKAKQSPTTMFKLGRNYGHLQMALAALEIPQHEEVLPRKWQAEFGLLRRPGETITQKKNRHKAVAQKIFPTIEVIHATADALLLAEWLRRKELPNVAEAKAE